MAGAVTLAALAAGAGSAQADIEKNLEYVCKYPLVDKKPLSINVKSNIPAFAKINEQQPAFVVNAIATAREGTSEAIETLDAYKLSGVSEARASLVFPSGFVQGNLKVPLTVDPYIRAAGAAVPDPLVLTANGKTPSVNLDELGKTDIRLDRISLNLAAFYDDGSPINVKKLQTGFNGEPVTDSDGDVNTFDVYCQLNADQSPIIATICVNATGLPDDSCGGGPDPVNAPPSKVAGLESSALTFSSVTLNWDPSTDPDAGDTVSYNVYKDGVKVTATPITGTTFTASGLTESTKYTFDVEATDGEDAAAKTSIDVTTPEEPATPDTTAPSAPTPKVDSITACPTGTVKISWTASTDEAGGSGLKGYVVNYKGSPVDVAAGTTTYTFNNVAAGPFSATLSAVDNAGNTSAPKEVTGTVPAPDCAPGKPVVTVGTTTTTSVALSWTAPSGTISGYNVYRNGTKVNAALVTGTTYTDSGLTPKTAYKYVVEAIAGDGTATKSDEASATTKDDVNPGTCPQGFACYDYSAKGSTSLKTLTQGTLPLSGGIKAQLNVADGKFTADLTLNNTSGRLTAAGFLPITAKVGFVPVGKTTGQLNDATATAPQSIETNSKVRIKVLEVKLFGAIPLAGGNSCQTKSLSDINLKSTNAFDPLKGGTIGGTYAISDLNGCGILNGLVSPLTAGKGNTITLALTKLP